MQMSTSHSLPSLRHPQPKTQPDLHLHPFLRLIPGVKCHMSQRHLQYSKSVLTIDATAATTLTIVPPPEARAISTIARAWVSTRPSATVHSGCAIRKQTSKYIWLITYYDVSFSNMGFFEMGIPASFEAWRSPRITSSWKILVRWTNTWPNEIKLLSAWFKWAVWICSGKLTSLQGFLQITASSQGIKSGVISKIAFSVSRSLVFSQKTWSFDH